jgi:hypothetical protein
VMMAWVPVPFCPFFSGENSSTDAEARNRRRGLAKLVTRFDSLAL